jgi:outer membrane lipoprotein-sorting protein
MRSFVLVLVVAVCLTPAVLFADEPAPKPAAPAKTISAAEVLAKVDKAVNAFKDAVWESKLLVKQPNGESREFGFTTYQKPDKRLVRFNSPGDVKGMGVLVEGRDTIYVYLPEFKRVRRMGTHVKNQTFMGSDFSFEDMSQTSYAGTFDVKLVSEDATSWTIDLTQKAGLDLEFPRLKMVVSKQYEQPTHIDSCDGSGRPLKTQDRSEWKKDGAVHWQPMKIVVTDHRRNDHSSEIDFISSKIDSGLPDDLFSVRSLQR